MFRTLLVLALDHNCLQEIPSQLNMPLLTDLALHDNDLYSLPSLTHLSSLTALRLDRNIHLASLPALPQSLKVLHLGGCSSLPGTYEDPHLLPWTVLDLQEVLDCMLPDNTHMGIFFGNPLPPNQLRGTTHTTHSTHYIQNEDQH